MNVFRAFARKSYFKWMCGNLQSEYGRRTKSLYCCSKRCPHKTSMDILLPPVRTSHIMNSTWRYLFHNILSMDSIRHMHVEHRTLVHQNSSNGFLGWNIRSISIRVSSINYLLYTWYVEMFIKSCHTIETKTCIQYNTVKHLKWLLPIGLLSTVATMQNWCSRQSLRSHTSMSKHCSIHNFTIRRIQTE